MRGAGHGTVLRHRGMNRWGFTNDAAWAGKGERGRQVTAKSIA